VAQATPVQIFDAYELARPLEITPVILRDAYHQRIAVREYQAACCLQPAFKDFYGVVVQWHGASVARFRLVVGDPGGTLIESNAYFSCFGGAAVEPPLAFSGRAAPGVT
jgi:hypothetical protein